MGIVVLNDGRVLQLSPEQQQALGMIILMAPDMSRGVRVGDETFTLDQIVTDREEISRQLQMRILDVPEVPVRSKNKKKTSQLS
jgi:hypothetical protein